MTVVEQERGHADQAAILHRTPVQHDHVPDDHVIAEECGEAVLGDMDDAAVLEIRAIADTDGVDVPPYDRVEPEAGLLAQHDIPDDDGRFRHEGRGGNDGADAVMGTDDHVEAAVVDGRPPERLANASRAARVSGRNQQSRKSSRERSKEARMAETTPARR